MNGKHEMAWQIQDPPHVPMNDDELALRLAGKRLAVSLNYDGTPTPIVDWPEDALISESMRNAVCELAGRCAWSAGATGRRPGSNLPHTTAQKIYTGGSDLLSMMRNRVTTPCLVLPRAVGVWFRC